MRLVILRAGDAIPEVAERHGEFGAWIRSGVGEVWAGTWAEVDLREDAPLPGALEAAGFIITGSASSVTERASWMLRTEEYLRTLHAEGAPILGICFGHQLLAQAMGGRVAKNPRGREIGTVHATQTANDPIFDGLSASFRVNTTHLDSVVELPPGARLLASTDGELNTAFALGASTRCVQFHPEIDGNVMRGYIGARAHLMKAEGLDADAAHAGATDAPGGAEVMRNFVRRFVRAR